MENRLENIENIMRDYKEFEKQKIKNEKEIYEKRIKNAKSQLTRSNNNVEKIKQELEIDKQQIEINKKQLHINKLKEEMKEINPSIEKDLYNEYERQILEATEESESLKNKLEETINNEKLIDAQNKVSDAQEKLKKASEKHEKTAEEKQQEKTERIIARGKAKKALVMENKNIDLDLEKKEIENQSALLALHEFKYKYDENRHPLNGDEYKELFDNYSKIQEEIKELKNAKSKCEEYIQEIDKEFDKEVEGINEVISKKDQENQEQPKQEEQTFTPQKNAKQDETEKQEEKETAQKQSEETSDKEKNWTDESYAKREAKTRLANTNGVGISKEKYGWTDPRVKIPSNAQQEQQSIEDKIKIEFNAKEQKYKLFKENEKEATVEMYLDEFNEKEYKQFEETFLKNYANGNRKIEDVDYRLAYFLNKTSKTKFNNYVEALKNNKDINFDLEYKMNGIYGRKYDRNIELSDDIMKVANNQKRLVGAKVKKSVWTKFLEKHDGIRKSIVTIRNGARYLLNGEKTVLTLSTGVEYDQNKDEKQKQSVKDETNKNPENRPINKENKKAIDKKAKTVTSFLDDSTNWRESIEVNKQEENQSSNYQEEDLREVLKSKLPKEYDEDYIDEESITEEDRKIILGSDSTNNQKEEDYFYDLGRTVKDLLPSEENEEER